MCKKLTACVVVMLAWLTASYGQSLANDTCYTATKRKLIAEKLLQGQECDSMLQSLVMEQVLWEHNFKTAQHTINELKAKEAIRAQVDNLRLEDIAALEYKVVTLKRQNITFKIGVAVAVAAGAYLVLK